MGLDLGFEFDAVVSFIPARIDKDGMRQLFHDVPEELKSLARDLLDKQWNIYVVKQTRGRCYARAKVITIPSWVLNPPRSLVNHIKNGSALKYKTWYIAHEFAHAYDECRHNHGPEFMEWLKRICPKDCIEYETEYKPRNAKSAGIGQKDWNDLLEL